MEWSLRTDREGFLNRQIVRRGDRNVRRDRVAAGGVTVDYAEQTTVLSLPALRRLRFPRPTSAATPEERNLLLRTVLAALALLGTELAAEGGLDLRSRCLLWPDGTREWELLDHPGETPRRYRLAADSALALFREAQQAASTELNWPRDSIRLLPSDELVELVRRSQEAGGEPAAEAVDEAGNQDSNEGAGA